MSISAVTLVFNSIQNTTRIYKITDFLIRSNSVQKINIIGLWDIKLPIFETLSEGRIIFRVKNLRQIASSKWIDNNIIARKIFALLGIIPLYFSVTKRVFKCKPEVIYCHDILWLPVAVLAKWVFKCRIIYMPHELETEETGTGNITKIFLKKIERYSFKHISYTVTVGDSITQWYKETYNTDKVATIRNIPNQTITIKDKSFLRKKCGIADNNTILFIYQGMLDESRGILELIDCFKMTSKDKHIVFMGYGPVRSYIEEASDNYKNIHFLQAVPQNEILEYTSGADIGVFFITENEISLSYKYSLPNKYYEYIKACIPILVSNNLESIVSDAIPKGIGWSLEPNLNCLSLFINNIDFNQVQKAKAAVEKVQDSYDWNYEVQILKYI